MCSGREKAELKNLLVSLQILLIPCWQRFPRWLFIPQNIIYWKSLKTSAVSILTSANTPEAACQQHFIEHIKNNSIYSLCLIHFRNVSISRDSNSTSRCPGCRSCLGKGKKPNKQTPTRNWLRCEIMWRLLGNKTIKYFSPKSHLLISNHTSTTDASPYFTSFPRHQLGCYQKIWSVSMSLLY